MVSPIMVAQQPHTDPRVKPPKLPNVPWNLVSLYDSVYFLKARDPQVGGVFIVMNMLLMMFISG